VSTLALIATDTQHTALGLPSRLHGPMRGQGVLQQTLQRVARVPGVEKIVLVHPQGQAPHELIDPAHIAKPVETHAAAEGLVDARTPYLRSARKWSLTAWRGGLGEAMVYDELLPPGPLHEAMQALEGEAALIARGDWCVVDPALAEAQLAAHLDDPEALPLTFSQAPPGLSPLVCSASMLQQLAQHHGYLGRILGYNPDRPQPDPIGRGANITIDAAVRDCNRRFIYDTDRSADLLDRIADHLGDAFPTADAKQITDAAREVESRDRPINWQPLPQQVNLELSPRRAVQGPVTAQAHVELDRPDLDAALGERIAQQLGAMDDVALTLGGLGDALLHPQWQSLTRAAQEAGVFGIAITTDLLCEKATLDALLQSPIDVVLVHVNAYSAATYQTMMGVDRFDDVFENLRYLLEQRRHLAESGKGEIGLPWLVPSLVKTPAAVDEIEPFFDRWMRPLGVQPMLAPAQTGCGKMPALSPAAMTPPRRVPCRQLGRRMTILAEGTVALCDQDWLGEAALGNTADEALTAIWQRVDKPRQTHEAEQWDELALCRNCGEWHRP